jgi:hypothetical protein
MVFCQISRKVFLVAASAWLDAKNHPMEFAFPKYQPAIIGFPAD